MGQGFGAYGKIPAMGDFLRIGLSPGFARPWDTWLQSAMITARAQLGENWTECYMSAPIWRFTLPGGLAGPFPVLGVLMPSVDRVGRQFPLTLAACLPADTDVMGAHLSAASCFARLEDIALDALEDSATSDGLADELAEVPGPTVAPVGSSATMSHWDEIGERFRVARNSAATTRDFGALSLWSCILGEEQRLLVADGWPSEGQTAGLFNPGDELWMGHTPQGRAG